VTGPARVCGGRSNCIWDGLSINFFVLIHQCIDALHGVESMTHNLPMAILGAERSAHSDGEQRPTSRGGATACCG
jgi:hypothetical protein